NVCFVPIATDFVQKRNMSRWVDRDGSARSLAGPVYYLRASMQAIGGFRRDGPETDILVAIPFWVAIPSVIG
ncbi:hypothetical protein, partial [Bradyrhizobium sp. SZCCHNRI2049]|uniref:hypothetical protein n=1 Tax=Bradyrhizobium sp. SZCCHNRI2049 TaxID=3057287 RepID=UPI002916A912